MCDDDADCDYFRFKDNRKAKKRICYLMKVVFTPKNGFTSGERFCGQDNTIFYRE